jgi:hypothetical protein
MVQKKNNMAEFDPTPVNELENEHGTFKTKEDFRKFMHDRSEECKNGSATNEFIICSKRTPYFIFPNIVGAPDNGERSMFGTNAKEDDFAHLFLGLSKLHTEGVPPPDRGTDEWNKFFMMQKTKAKLMSCGGGSTNGIRLHETLNFGGCLCKMRGAPYRCEYGDCFTYSTVSHLALKKREERFGPAVAVDKRYHNCTLLAATFERSLGPSTFNACMQAANCIAQDNEVHFSACNILKTQLVINEWEKKISPFEGDAANCVNLAVNTYTRPHAGTVAPTDELSLLIQTGKVDCDHKGDDDNAMKSLSYLVTLRFVVNTGLEGEIVDRMFSDLDPSDLVREEPLEKGAYFKKGGLEILPRLVAIKRPMVYDEDFNRFYSCVVVELDYSMVSHIVYDHPVPEYIMPNHCSCDGGKVDIRDCETFIENGFGRGDVGDEDDEPMPGKGKEEVGEDAPEETTLPNTKGYGRMMSDAMEDNLLSQRLFDSATKSGTDMSSHKEIETEGNEHGRQRKKWITRQMSSAEYLVPPGLPPRIVTARMAMKGIMKQWNGADGNGPKGGVQGFSGTMGTEKPEYYVFQSASEAKEEDWNRRASVRDLVDMIGRQCETWTEFATKVLASCKKLRSSITEPPASDHPTFPIHLGLYSVHFFVAAAVYNSGLEMWSPVTDLFLHTNEIGKDTPNTKAALVSPFIKHHLTLSRRHSLMMHRARKPLFFNVHTSFTPRDMATNMPEYSKSFPTFNGQDMGSPVSGYGYGSSTDTDKDGSGDDDSDDGETVPGVKTKTFLGEVFILSDDDDDDIAEAENNENGANLPPTAPPPPPPPPSPPLPSFPPYIEGGIRFSRPSLKPQSIEVNKQRVDSLSRWFLFYIVDVVNAGNVVMNHEINMHAHGTHLLDRYETSDKIKEGKYLKDVCTNYCKLFAINPSGIRLTIPVGATMALLGYKVQYALGDSPVVKGFNDGNQFANIRHHICIYDIAKYLVNMAVSHKQIRTMRTGLDPVLDFAMLSSAKRNSITTNILTNSSVAHPDFLFGESLEDLSHHRHYSHHKSCNDEHYFNCLFNCTDNILSTIKNQSNQEDWMANGWTGKHLSPYCSGITMGLIVGLEARVKTEKIVVAIDSNKDQNIVESSTLSRQKKMGGNVLHHFGGGYPEVSAFLLYKHDVIGLLPLTTKALMKTLMGSFRGRTFLPNISVPIQEHILSLLVNPFMDDLSGFDKVAAIPHVRRFIITGFCTTDFTTNLVRDDLWWFRSSKTLYSPPEGLSMSMDLAAAAATATFHTRAAGVLFQKYMTECVSSDERLAVATGGRAKPLYSARPWNSANIDCGDITVDSLTYKSKCRKIEGIPLNTTAKENPPPPLCMVTPLSIYERGTGKTGHTIRMIAMRKNLSLLSMPPIAIDESDMRPSHMVQMVHTMHMSSYFMDFHLLIDGPAMFDPTKYAPSLVETVSWSPDHMCDLANDISSFVKLTGCPPFAGLINFPTIPGADSNVSGSFGGLHQYYSYEPYRALSGIKKGESITNIMSADYKRYMQKLNAQDCSSLRGSLLYTFIKDHAERTRLFAKGSFSEKESATVCDMAFDINRPKLTSTLWSHQRNRTSKHIIPDHAEKNYYFTGFDMHTAFRAYGFSCGALDGILGCKIPIPLFDRENMLHYISCPNIPISEKIQTMSNIGFQEHQFLTTLEAQLYGNEYAIMLRAIYRLEVAFPASFFIVPDEDRRPIPTKEWFKEQLRKVDFGDASTLSNFDFSPSLLMVRLFVDFRKTQISDFRDDLASREAIFVDDANSIKEIMFVYTNYITTLEGAWASLSEILSANSDHVVVGGSVSGTGNNSPLIDYPLLVSKGGISSGMSIHEVDARKRKRSSELPSAYEFQRGYDIPDRGEIGRFYSSYTGATKQTQIQISEGVRKHFTNVQRGVSNLSTTAVYTRSSTILDSSTERAVLDAVYQIENCILKRYVSLIQRKKGLFPECRRIVSCHPSALTAMSEYFSTPQPPSSSSQSPPTLDFSNGFPNSGGSNISYRFPHVPEVVLHQFTQSDSNSIIASSADDTDADIVERDFLSHLHGHVVASTTSSPLHRILIDDDDDDEDVEEIKELPEVFLDLMGTVNVMDCDYIIGGFNRELRKDEKERIVRQHYHIPRNPSFMYKIPSMSASTYACVSIPRNPNDIDVCRGFFYDMCTLIDMVHANAMRVVQSTTRTDIPTTISHPWIGACADIPERVATGVFSSGPEGLSDIGISPFSFVSKSVYEDGMTEQNDIKDHKSTTEDDQAKYGTQLSSFLKNQEADINSITNLFMSNLNFCVYMSHARGADAGGKEEYAPIVLSSVQLMSWSSGIGTTRAVITEFFRIYMDPRYGYCTHCYDGGDLSASSRAETKEQFVLPSAVFALHPDLHQMTDPVVVVATTTTTTTTTTKEGGGTEPKKEGPTWTKREGPNPYCYPGSSDKYTWQNEETIKNLKNGIIYAVISHVSVTKVPEEACSHNTGPRYLPSIIPIMLAKLVKMGLTTRAKFHPYLFGFGENLMQITPTIKRCVVQESHYVEPMLSKKGPSRRTQMFVEEGVIVPQSQSDNILAVICDRIYFGGLSPKEDLLHEKSLRFFCSMAFGMLPRLKKGLKESMKHKPRGKDSIQRKEWTRSHNGLKETYTDAQNILNTEHIALKFGHENTFISTIKNITMDTMRKTGKIDLLTQVNYPRMDTDMCSDWNSCMRNANPKLCNCNGNTTRDCKTVRAHRLIDLSDWYLNWGIKFRRTLSARFMIPLHLDGYYSMAHGLASNISEEKTRVSTVDGQLVKHGDCVLLKRAMGITKMVTVIITIPLLPNNIVAPYSAETISLSYPERLSRRCTITPNLFSRLHPTIQHICRLTPSQRSTILSKMATRGAVEDSTPIEREDRFWTIINKANKHEDRCMSFYFSTRDIGNHTHSSVSPKSRPITPTQAHIHKITEYCKKTFGNTYGDYIAAITSWFFGKASEETMRGFLQSVTNSSNFSSISPIDVHLKPDLSNTKLPKTGQTFLNATIISCNSRICIDTIDTVPGWTAKTPNAHIIQSSDIYRMIDSTLDYISGKYDKSVTQTFGYT